MAGSVASLFDQMKVDAGTSHLLRERPGGGIVGRLRPDSVVVELTKQEYLDMAMVAVYRMMLSEVRDFRQNAEAERTIRNDLQGILGEAAFCKALGLDLEVIVGNEERSMAEKRTGDIGRYEVRTTTGLVTPRSSSGRVGYYSRLIHRAHDDPQKVYVLVLGVGVVYEIAGWLAGADIRRDEWANQGGEGRPGAWMAPLEALRPIRTLPDATLREHVMDERIAALSGKKDAKAQVDPSSARIRDIDALWNEARMMHFTREKGQY